MRRVGRAGRRCICSLRGLAGRNTFFGWLVLCPTVMEICGFDSGFGMVRSLLVIRGGGIVLYRSAR